METEGFGHDLVDDLENATCSSVLEIFSQLAVKLPEILLGGSFNGVRLQNEIFLEPGESPVFAGPNKWERGASRRRERFEHVVLAVARLMHWASAERRAFITKTMVIAPSSSKRVQQGLDSDLPKVDDADVSSEGGSDVPNVDDADDMEIGWRRSCSRPAVGGSRGSSAVLPAVDLMTDTISPASSLAEAAFDLDVACSNLYTKPQCLAAEDIAVLLEKCEDEENHTAATIDNHNDLEENDSSSEDSHSDCEENASSSKENIPISPVVDGLMDLGERKRLAHGYMANKASNQSVKF